MAKKKKVTKEVVSLKDMMNEMDVEPKKGRSRLRKAGHNATDGRYPDMTVGSKLHSEFVDILSA